MMLKLALFAALAICTSAQQPFRIEVVWDPLTPEQTDDLTAYLAQWRQCLTPADVLVSVRFKSRLAAIQSTHHSLSLTLRSDPLPPGSGQPPYCRY
jgi:hypothetical protein